MRKIKCKITQTLADCALLSWCLFFFSTLFFWHDSMTLFPTRLHSPFPKNHLVKYAASFWRTIWLSDKNLLRRCLKSNEILTYSPEMFCLDTSKSLRGSKKAEPVENCQILRNHVWFRKPLCTTHCCRLVCTETISKTFLCSCSLPIHPLLAIISGRS